MEHEHLLSKVLVIDRTTVHVVNSTWQDGLQVALKLWACAGLFDEKLMCSYEKTRLRKRYVKQRCFEWCSLTVY